MGDLLEQLDSLRALGHSSANLASGSNNQPHVHAPPPLDGVRQDILKRFDALETKQRQILLEWPELKSAWNRSLVITQLPNEILFRIFVYVSEQPKPKDSRKYYVQNNEDFLELGLVKTELVKLTLVCRRWRDMALATPSLWRTIDVGKTSDWMNLALTRSGNATIDVSFPSGFSEEHATLLTPHCYRLRSLRLQSYSPCVIRIIRNILPALETLEISSNWHVGLNAEDCTDLGLARERFPNIRALQLIQNIIPGDPLFYARLRKLSLKACYFKETVDLDQFPGRQTRSGGIALVTILALSASL
ncbi:hypothetical protein GSI_13218 [Ganoderma sinense ZZ0214-1]|uniref:F-box domain-containing protein n=1 Tax=Ganoderma sinense ZZ0214-1 TaxID=1077348 RepID=A0A2G8RV07_9APHY|nr:hypothetical protein GSI_13218 [Ganoderma sinense ZZ0214-1]